MATRAKKARQTSPARSDDILRQETPARSVSEGTDSNSIDRLTEVMANFIKAAGSSSTGVSTRGEVVPIFDPDDREQNSESWCLKVDELREIFKWSEDATIYFALSKLRGLAQVWYKGLQTVKFSWDEWKEKLKTAFPYKRDFYETLGDITRRRKRPEETYSKYFYEMLALLNICKITGRDAVSCIIGGIDNIIVKTGAKSGNYQSPEDLYQYLSSVGEGSVFSATHNYGKTIRNKRKLHSNPFISTRRNNPRDQVTCFTCGKVGHKASACDKKNQATEKRCSFCRKRGHFERHCFLKKHQGATKETVS